MFTMNDLFQIAIKMENNGETIYSDSVKKTTHPELKSMLEWMASEEAIHGKWFSERKNNLSLGKDEASLNEMVPKVLQNMMGEKTLGLDEINFKELTTVSKLLETFIGFEKETIMFYELLEMFVESESVRTGLHNIIQEEKNHVEKLEIMIASLCEESL